MLIKAGVDISRLNPEIRRALTVIERVVRDIEDEELVITSTYEGNHLPGSLHYANDAVDIRRFKDAGAVRSDIYITLGKNFFVYLASTHIHIGYDPK